jgi:hypothetical protein
MGYVIQKFNGTRWKKVFEKKNEMSAVVNAEVLYNSRGVPMRVRYKGKTIIKYSKGEANENNK